MTIDQRLLDDTMRLRNAVKDLQEAWARLSLYELDKSFKARIQAVKEIAYLDAIIEPRNSFMRSGDGKFFDDLVSDLVQTAAKGEHRIY